MTEAPTYRERLSVPLRWWVQGTMLIFTLWIAVIVAVPGVLAWAVTVAALALMTALYLGYGAPVLSVGGGWFRAGRAHIELHHLGAAEALDEEAARRVAGPEADARAYLLLRPYRKRAIRVFVTDPADPTPYWLVSTRRPDELVRALDAARTTPGGAPSADSSR